MTSETLPLPDGDAASPPKITGDVSPRGKHAAEEPTCWRPTGATAA